MHETNKKPDPAVTNVIKSLLSSQLSKHKFEVKSQVLGYELDEGKLVTASSNTRCYSMHKPNCV